MARCRGRHAECPPRGSVRGPLNDRHGPKAEGPRRQCSVRVRGPASRSSRLPASSAVLSLARALHRHDAERAGLLPCPPRPPGDRLDADVTAGAIADADPLIGGAGSATCRRTPASAAASRVIHKADAIWRICSMTKVVSVAALILAERDRLPRPADRLPDSTRRQAASRLSRTTS
jgi:hypothetical protein